MAMEALNALVHLNGAARTLEQLAELAAFDQRCSMAESLCFLAGGIRDDIAALRRAVLAHERRSSGPACPVLALVPTSQQGEPA